MGIQNLRRTPMSNRLFSARQTTINQEIEITGTGVHSGQDVTISLHPASPGTGIKFITRSNPGGCGDDLHPGDITEIQATYQAVSNVTLCTVLADGNGARVATVEHLIAALRGLNIDNVIIEVNNIEVPIMDGSAAPFVDAIERAGIQELPAQRRYIKVLKPVRVSEGESFCEFRPYDGCRFDVEINFDCKVIGRQYYALDLTPERFRKEIAGARTFGFIEDVEHLWASGRALGASFENTVALDDERVLNPEGLRWRDEFVRHKLLDAVGDIALAGAPVLGAFRSCRGGHRLNFLTLKALMEDSEAWTIVEAPRVREIKYADFARSLEAAHMAAQNI